MGELCEEAEKKGKVAQSTTSGGTSSLARSSISRPPVSSISTASPVSLVASSHPTEELEAAEASVPNGSRGQVSARGYLEPPPYMPDLEAGRMTGHSNESDETRLSGYVKNQSFPGVE